MHQAFTTPHVCYLVEATSPGQGHAFFFRIDQALPLPRGPRERDRVHNQVESHLNQLHSRTGLIYDLIYWSDPVRFTQYIKENSIELS